MSFTDSYKSRDLEPGVILTKFLIFGRFSVLFVGLIKRILIKKKRCTVMIYNTRNRSNDTTESQKEKKTCLNAHFQYRSQKLQD